MTTISERFSIAGKKALITGASKGIGAEICRVFAEAGADIVAVARDRAGLLEISADVSARGKKCLILDADLSTKEGPVNAAREA